MELQYQFVGSRSDCGFSLYGDLRGGAAIVECIVVDDMEEPLEVDINTHKKSLINLSGMLSSEMPPQVSSNTPLPTPRHLAVKGSSKVGKIGRKHKPQNQLPRRKSSRLYNQSPGGLRLPVAPDVSQCWVHFYMTHVGKAKATNDKYIDDYVVSVEKVARLARDHAWEMSGIHWFGGGPLDCMAAILHLEEQARLTGAKKIWYLRTIDSDLYCRPTARRSRYLGEWAEMEMIALPMNMTNDHFFLIVLSFLHKKVFILDSFGRNSADLTAKIQYMHQNLYKDFPNDYANNFDITKWPRELVLENVPTQGNSWDCGPYVCFFMKHLRDLIPKPKVAYKVVEPYLRIWVANYIGDSCYNSVRQDLIKGCNNFKAKRENQDKFDELYENICMRLDNGKKGDN